MSNREPQVVRPYHGAEAITVRHAAEIAQRSLRTIREWAARFDLGRCIRGSHWRISIVALWMHLEGDEKALNFDKTAKLIVATVGDRQICQLLGPDFLRWHRNCSAPAAEGKPTRPWRAKHCLDAVRRMVAYGVTLGYSDCARSDAILGKMRFPTPPARRAKLEVAHVNAIRPIAHDMGLGSIALATVLQFELSLRQKDVIGEWEPAPLSEGSIAHRGTRWANGLKWSHIDSVMILRKTHTKTGAYVEFDLRLYPAVLEELDPVPRERRIGPMIVSEHTGEPYKHRTFTQTLAQGRRQGRSAQERLEHGRQGRGHLGSLRRRGGRD